MHTVWDNIYWYKVYTTRLGVYYVILLLSSRRRIALQSSCLVQGVCCVRFVIVVRGGEAGGSVNAAVTAVVFFFFFLSGVARLFFVGGAFRICRQTGQRETPVGVVFDVGVWWPPLSLETFCVCRQTEQRETYLCLLLSSAGWGGGGTPRWAGGARGDGGLSRRADTLSPANLRAAHSKVYRRVLVKSVGRVPCLTAFCRLNCCLLCVL